MFQGSQPKVLEREEAVASHCQKRTQESEPIILSLGTFIVAGQVERKSILTESVGERRPSKSARKSRKSAPKIRIKLLKIELEYPCGE